MGLASRTKVQFNSEMNLDCSSLEPGSAPFGELRRLSDLWNSEYPRVELSRFSLAARGHRQLHVFDSEDRCHSHTPSAEHRGERHAKVRSGHIGNNLVQRHG